MEAAVCESPGKIGFRSMPVPEVVEGNVLVKLEGCGVCGSNLPLWEGRPWFKYPLEPGAPGHEGWGRVERVGCNVRGVKEGDRVAVLSSHAFARYDLVPAGSLVVLPSELDNIPFPGEPLGCAMNIINRCDIREGQIVAVVGAGFIGALLISLAAKRNATVLALSRRRSSLDVALSSGASSVILLTEDQEVIEAVGRVTGERFCDRVIEATGYQWPLDIAGKVVNEGGKLIIAGYHQDGLRSVNMQQWNWKGIDVINAHERKTSRYVEGMGDAVGAILTGELDPSRLYTHVFPLEQLSSAFEALRTRPEGFVKALVTL
ncbi:MAG: alcohol dehydrogenase catalytic domain-containing protein [Fibrobacter sp.]|nr:alcohol dehydrogenase catalytic domain-containing protein [Fibrobacter sp.]